MSSYMLIHGDCMDSFGLIHDHSVNLVLADPPYGITQNTWDVVLPFDDFIEYDGKNFNYEKYLLHCFKKNIPYKNANEEWNKRKQHGIWSQGTIHNSILNARVCSINARVRFCAFPRIYRSFFVRKRDSDSTNSGCSDLL